MRLSEVLNKLKIIILLFLFVIFFKLSVGWITNAKVLIADAFHSFSDLVVILVAYIGIWISTWKADDKFKYGYYKAETIAALFVSFFVILVGLGIILDSIFEKTEKIVNPWLAIFATIVTALISLFISKYEEKISQEYNLHSLEATSEEAFGDFLTSLGTIISILSNIYGIPIIEKIILFIFGIVILKTGLKTMFESIIKLMDISPEEYEKKIYKEISKEFEIKDLKLRESGPFIFGECTLVLDNDLSLDKAHEKITLLEKKLYSKFPCLQHMNIHFEPKEKNKYIVLIPVDENEELAEHFLKADYFYYFSLDKDGNYNLIKKEKNKLKTLEKGKGKELINYLKGVDVIIIKNIGEMAYNLARANNIKILTSENKNIYWNLKNINKLKEYTGDKNEDVSL